MLPTYHPAANGSQVVAVRPALTSGFPIGQVYRGHAVLTER